MATDGRSAEERDAFVSSLRDTVPVAVVEEPLDRTAAMKAAIVAAGGEVVG